MNSKRIILSIRGKVNLFLRGSLTKGISWYLLGQQRFTNAKHGDKYFIMAEFVFEGDNTLIKESGLTSVAAVAVVTNLSLNHPHNFFAVQFFDANGGGVLATGGTVLFEVLLMTSKVFEAPPANIIEANESGTVSVAGPIRAVRATPTGILTAVQYKIVVSQHKS